MTHKLSSQDTDPLASCVVPGITPRIYRLSAAYATIEDTSVAKAGNRWKYLRLNFPDDISHKLGTVTCVDEAGMLLILKTMKETTQKSQALRVRGVVDDADGLRVREIVLHSEGHVVKIQIDYTTQRIPVNETICLLGFTANAAELQIIDIRAKHPTIAAAIGEAIQVNGVGKARLCADLPTMLEILWLLPSNARTSAFRVKCAKDIARQMRGDPTLVADLERNRAILESTGGIHVHETPAIEASEPRSPRTMGVFVERHTMEMAERRVTLELNRTRAAVELETNILKLDACHIENLVARAALLDSMGTLCDRAKSAIRDSVENYNPRKHVREACTEQEAICVVDHAPALPGPFQISEIMEFQLDFPADVVRRYTSGAGTAVAKEFMVHYPGGVCLSAARVIDGCRRTVNAYDARELWWIKPVITEYVAKKQQEAAAQANPGAPNKKPKG